MYTNGIRIDYGLFLELVNENTMNFAALMSIIFEF